jgi:hypothetical protein
LRELERVRDIIHPHPNHRIDTMAISSGLRCTLVAATALAGLAFSSGAQAATCAISFSVIKGGWVIGASAGSGTLRCGRRSYPISIGGLSAGIVFGGSETNFHGRASFIRSPYDVAGVYGAAGAGAAVGVGAQVITLRNEKGAVLNLSGRQVGLQVNADLSGLSISMK